MSSNHDQPRRSPPGSHRDGSGNAYVYAEVGIRGSVMAAVDELDDHATARAVGDPDEGEGGGR